MYFLPLLQLVLIKYALGQRGVYVVLFLAVSYVLIHPEGRRMLWGMYELK